jgi:hypothetical protein
LFWDKISLCSPAWPQTPGLKRYSCLSLPRSILDYRHILSSLAVFFCLFVWQHWGLNLGMYPAISATPQALFCVGCFWDRVSWNICPGLVSTLLFLISAFWVARITGLSHWCLLCFFFFFNKISKKLSAGFEQSIIQWFSFNGYGIKLEKQWKDTHLKTDYSHPWWCRNKIQ